MRAEYAQLWSFFDNRLFAKRAVCHYSRKMQNRKNISNMKTSMTRLVTILQK